MTLAESNSMPYICHLQGDVVQVLSYKKSFRLAAFPGERVGDVSAVARKVYEQYEPVPTVLDSNIAAAGNPPIHATLAIPVAGLYFDRYGGASSTRTPPSPGARLVTAHDAERERLARRPRVRLLRIAVRLRQAGLRLRWASDIAEAHRSSPHADWMATPAYLEQVISEDLIYQYVPLIRLGAALGVDLPVTRGMVDIMGAILQRDYWMEGLALADLGLDGLDRDGILRFVTTGER